MAHSVLWAAAQHHLELMHQALGDSELEHFPASSGRLQQSVLRIRGGANLTVLKPRQEESSTILVTIFRPGVDQNAGAMSIGTEADLHRAYRLAEVPDRALSALPVGRTVVTEHRMV